MIGVDVVGPSGARAWSAGRLTTLAAIAAPWAVALAGANAGPPRTDGPFNVLEWRNGVTTSRSGYAVWVWVPSSRHQARVPGHKGQIGSEVDPFQWTAYVLGFMQLPGGGSRGPWVSDSPAPGDDGAGYTILR